MYNIISSHPFGITIEHDVIATPRLIDEGTRGPVQAYRFSEYNGKGVWRVRDDSYDAPDTIYREVRVEVVR